MEVMWMWTCRSWSRRLFSWPGFDNLTPLTLQCVGFFSFSLSDDSDDRSDCRSRISVCKVSDENVVLNSVTRSSLGLFGWLGVNAWEGLAPVRCSDHLLKFRESLHLSMHKNKNKLFVCYCFFFGVVVASIASVYCFVSVPTIPWVTRLITLTSTRRKELNGDNWLLRRRGLLALHFGHFSVLGLN